MVSCHIRKLMDMKTVSFKVVTLTDVYQKCVTRMSSIQVTVLPIRVNRYFEQCSSLPLPLRHFVISPSSLFVPKSTRFIHVEWLWHKRHHSAHCTNCLRTTSYALRNHEYLPTNIRAITTDGPSTLHVESTQPFPTSQVRNC